MIPEIRIADYTYSLPEERIARFPLEKRDSSRLLVATSATGFTPAADTFSNIPKWIPENSFMVFNEAKVVPARLIFRRRTGAEIEIFCLEPETPSDYQQNFASTSSCRWKVMIGNGRRWKGDEPLNIAISGRTGRCSDAESRLAELDLTARRGAGGDSVVEFAWDGGLSFSEVLSLCGNIPIPPYLKRESLPLDSERYQTLYARREGSVAAPTAGLHFTGEVLYELDRRGVTRESLCLHVGAGTFLPVKSETIAGHTMHCEPFEVSRRMLASLIAAIKEGRPVTAVGTTSTRCLESLYFIGAGVLEGGAPQAVPQWGPYRDEGYDYTALEALSALLGWMERSGADSLVARTGIIIVPSYRFRITDYLVTNFHQPQSTLLLLIAAFAGEKWHDLYKFALENDFRFLSYGDSSLLENIRRDEKL